VSSSRNPFPKSIYETIRLRARFNGFRATWNEVGGEFLRKAFHLGMKTRTKPRESGKLPSGAEQQRLCIAGRCDRTGG